VIPEDEKQKGRTMPKKTAATDFVSLAVNLKREERLLGVARRVVRKREKTCAELKEACLAAVSSELGARTPTAGAGPGGALTTSG
jgi:hypothetical protein